MKSLAILLLAGLTAFGQARIREPLTPGGKSVTDARIAADSQALALKPGNNKIAAALALDYIQKMRETVNFDYLNRSAKLVDDILERDPGNYEALRLRSEIGMERHDFALVADYSLEMTKYAPNDPGAWGNLGDASMDLGEYARAGDAYSKMLQLRPDLASYNRVAWYRFVTGDPDKAIQLMQNAINAGNPKPENVAWCLADLGGIYWKTGKADDAAAAYRRALSVYPNYYPAWAGLGRIASALNQVHDAIEDFRKAQDTVPMPEYAQALQDLYTRAGAPKLAKQQSDLIDAIEITMLASGEKTNRNVALLYADQNRKLDRARELVENEVKVRPDVYTEDALAWVLYRQGNFQEAWQASVKARALNTPEPVFHFHAGMIAGALGDKEASRAELAKALELNPHFEFSQAAIARARLAEK